MSITLRRKMFKLGGETNTHGIGITSGLEYRRDGYNQGGAVEQRVGYQSADHPSRQGNREGHGFNLLSLLPFVMPGVTTLGKVGSRTSKGGIDALKRFFKPRTGRGPGGERVVPGSPIRTTTPRGTTIRSKTIKTPGDRLPPGFRDYLKMAPRYAGATVGGLGSLGAVSSLLPQFDDSPDDTLGENILDTGRSMFEGAFDLMTGLPSTALQAPFRKAEDIQRPSNIISETLYGKKDEDKKIGSSLVDDSIPKDTQRTQEEEFSRMVEDSKRREDLYYAALSDGPNKVEALKRAALYAGENIDEGLGEGFKGIAQGVSEVLDEDAVIRNEAKRAAVSDVIGGETQRQQMFDQAKLAIMSSPELTPEQRSKAIQGIEAYENGIVDILPTNEKGDAADDSRMAAGTVYYDPANLYGGMYVAKPRTPGAESKPFNDLSEAQAHARS
jgi:hypothetical protein